MKDFLKTLMAGQFTIREVSGLTGIGRKTLSNMANAGIGNSSKKRVRRGVPRVFSGIDVVSFLAARWLMDLGVSVSFASLLQQDMAKAIECVMEGKVGVILTLYVEFRAADLGNLTRIATEDDVGAIYPFFIRYRNQEDLIVKLSSRSVPTEPYNGTTGPVNAADGILPGGALGTSTGAFVDLNLLLRSINQNALTKSNDRNATKA